jgi:hypothetical protein
MTTKNKISYLKVLEIFGFIAGPVSIATIFVSDSLTQKIASLFHLQEKLWLVPLIASLPLYALMLTVCFLWNGLVGDWIENGVARCRLYWGHLDGAKRNQQPYKNGLKRLLIQSRSLYFQLISGYTMAWDDQEEFILDVLRDLSPEDRMYKEFKVLLLDPDCVAFKRRAEWFIAQMNDHHSKGHHDKGRVDSVAEYVKRCKAIADELKRLGAEIRYYNYDPIWRIHLFDNVVLVSYYSDSKAGHQTSVNVFPRGDTDGMYYAFLKRFKIVFGQGKV